MAKAHDDGFNNWYDRLNSGPKYRITTQMDEHEEYIDTNRVVKNDDSELTNQMLNTVNSVEISV